MQDTVIGVTVYCSGNIYYLLVRQEEKGVTQDEMVGWHHRLNRHECEQSPGNCEVQGSLVCCSPWDCKELHMIEQLYNNSKGRVFLALKGMTKTASKVVPFCIPSSNG